MLISTNTRERIVPLLLSPVHVHNKWRKPHDGVCKRILWLEISMYVLFQISYNCCKVKFTVNGSVSSDVSVS